MKPLILLLSLWAVSASAAPACDEEPANLLASKNCGFTSDIEGWVHEFQGGLTEHDAREGSSAPGSLAVTGLEDGITIFSPCLEVQPSRSYRASAATRVAGNVFSCTLTGRQYTDTSCSEGRDRLDLSVDLPTTADWKTSNGETTINDTSRSMRLHFECNADDGFRLLIDDVSLVPAPG